MRISDWSSDVCSSDLCQKRDSDVSQSAFPPLAACWALLPSALPSALECGGEWFRLRSACARCGPDRTGRSRRSEEHTSELQSLMRNSYAVFCLKKQKRK